MALTTLINTRSDSVNSSKYYTLGELEAISFLGLNPEKRYSTTNLIHLICKYRQRELKKIKGRRNLENARFEILPAIGWLTNLVSQEIIKGTDYEEAVKDYMEAQKCREVLLNSGAHSKKELELAERKLKSELTKNGLKLPNVNLN